MGSSAGGSGGGGAADPIYGRLTNVARADRIAITVDGGGGGGGGNGRNDSKDTKGDDGEDGLARPPPLFRGPPRAAKGLRPSPAFQGRLFSRSRRA